MEWEVWLEKKNRTINDDFPKGNPPIKKKPTMFPRIRREFEDDADDKEYKNAAWESWLEKNNAIETSHKDEKEKHEWDGKFSSSTIRDDAKDEKAMDEESDEIMEDAGLEEIEKLKSWEVFLKGTGGVESAPSPEPSENIDMTGKNPTKRQRGRGVGTPQTIDGKTVPREVAQKPSGNVKTSRAGTFQDTKGTKNLTADDIEASAKRIGMITNNDLGAGTDKHVKTQEELDKEFYERTQPEPKGTKSHKKVIARRKRKSWEVWLEKDSLDGKQSPDGLPKLTAGGKEVKIEAKNVIDRDDRGKKNDMYKSWLEKMQGAGDARFGNQHLTGLDQKPVNNEEDEANIMPEKEEKTDDKEEKQEETDNKPYKALGGE
jgi:hypothetical protein